MVNLSRKSCYCLIKWHSSMATGPIIRCNPGLFKAWRNVSGDACSGPRRICVNSPCSIRRTKPFSDFLLSGISSDQARSHAIKFLNVLKLFITKLTQWDNLERNLPSQNQVRVEDQTLSKASTRNTENVASPVYHTTQNTNLRVSRFSVLGGVHLLEYKF
jgi:hypothetical protein